ncbi:MAG: Gfo/Idh/MocA family oxidoreductase [Firmicutes bacterium]|nr:Gfo/Idh/MocA family oxidoreductase [Bacillota bacterium]
MENRVKKVGILGCAKILPISLLFPLKNIDGIKVGGIASHDKERADEYGKKYGLPFVYDNFDELIKSDSIDFVYIVLSNELHAEWALKAAQAKKHLLIEKPLCLKATDYKEIEKKCQVNQVHLLEAIMVQHHPWQKYIIDIKNSGQYGRLKRVTTRASFIAKDNFLGNYRSSPEKGGGAFYDLGSYWMQFLQCLGQLKNASYNGKSSFNGPNGCDWTFNAQLIFDDGIISEFTCSFEMPYQACHELEFESAKITMPNFFGANLGNRKMSLIIEDFNKESKETVFFPPQNYYVNQLKFFANVLDGLTPNISLEQTYERILFMEEIYKLAK